jgi:D-xylose transport system substrate-binding protein
MKEQIMFPPKRFYPIMWAFLIGALLFSAYATPAKAQTEPIKIALLLPDANTARYDTKDMPAFKAKLAAICPSCKLIYNNAKSDANAQLSAAEAALANGAKVIAIMAVDTKAAAIIADKAKAAGVPVISYSRLLMNSDGVSYAVLADVPAIGRGQAQGLVDRLNELKIANPQIVMINGSPADSNMPLMKEGAMQVFGPLVKAGKLTIAKSYDTPGWDPAKAQSEMQQALTALGNKVDGVFAMNDGTAGGIVAAFLAAGINPIPPITGGDCDLAAMQRILVGQQLGSSYFPITTMAETAAVMAYDLATTGTVPADMIQTKVNNGAKDIPAALAGSVFVTKSNMKATVIADGWWTVDQICTPEFDAAGKAAGLK